MALSPGCRAACVTVVAVLLFGLSPPAVAQQITYEYDALGRLILMTSPEGVAQWEYDAVGNMLRIITRRAADVSGPVAILGMSPTRGVSGTTVRLYGRGFGAAPADNQVAFNGTTATVTAATTGTLTVTVPSGATTGPITVTAPQGAATSPDPFTVLTFAVTPNQAVVVLAGSADFEAVQGGVALTGVTWRVNGRAGGDATVGTISSTGRYTAPTTLPATQPLTVEAMHPTEPGAMATAAVQVVGQASGYEAAAPVTVGPTPRPPAVTASPVTVGRVATSAPTASAAVSVSRGPLIQAVTPAAALPGTTAALTVTGGNLQGATAVRFLRNGILETALAAGSIVVAVDGTSLTCAVTVGGSATQGPRIMQVLTPQGISTDVDLGTNRFTVTAP